MATTEKTAVHRKVSSCDRCAWEPDSGDDLCLNIVVAGMVWVCMGENHSVWSDSIIAWLVRRGFG